jgi:type IV secretory pathway VirB2 component (pilin)
VKRLTKERLVTAAAVLAVTGAAPGIAYAQTIGAIDPGTIVSNAVAFLEGPFGIGVGSIIVIILAILLAIGRHTYEGILLIIMAIALYFGGPGLINRIAGGG